MASLRQRKDKDKDKQKVGEDESKGSETKKDITEAKAKSKKSKEAVNARIEKQRRMFAWVSLFFSLWAIAVMLSLGYVVYEKHLEHTRAQELKKINDQVKAQAGAQGGSGTGSSGGSSGGTAADAKEQPKVYHAPEGGILMTAEELAKYDGTGEKCYLSILGEVYDVSSGEYYRGGGGYEFFAGRDASRGFHTGGDGEDLGSIEGLKVGALSGIVGWTIFYQQHENYTYVGKLVGTFYDEEGNPTQAKLDAIAAYSKIQEMQEVFEEERKDEPDCNRWWNRESQKTEVYCSDEMIVHRELTSRLVPRKKMHPIDDRLRCACIELKKAKQDTETYIPYSTCNPSSHSCILGEGE